MVNLDCMPIEELRELLPQLTQQKGMKSPLREYARLRIMATEYRTAGNIAKALAAENECDWLYARLPTELKW